MAGLIVKSLYTKGGGSGGYLQYIGTRERVEILLDGRPSIRKQEQLITKLVKDFLDIKTLGEYNDYTECPTKANASALITVALEEHWDEIHNSDGYAKYIAARSRAERLGSHGLSGDGDVVDLDAAMAEVPAYQGNIWAHIISLKRENAARLGYDSAKAWRTPLQANRYEIVATMNIPSNYSRRYAAFHDEGEHPHVYVMVQSTQPGEAHFTRDGIRRIKSVFTNQILQQKIFRTYEQRSASRDELVRQTWRTVAQLTREMAGGICNCPEAEVLMQKLAVQLEIVKGKKSYGYLPKPVKKTMDEIADELEKLPVVKQCYEQWLALQDQVDSYYRDSPRERKKLSQEKEFRAIKNAIIQEAKRTRPGEPTFEDQEMEGMDEQPNDRRMSFEYQELWRFILDERQSSEFRDQGAERLEWPAKQRDTHAQFVMGQLYRDGPLLIPGSQKAKRRFTLVTERGMLEAQHALGKPPLSEDPEVHDPEGGFQWLRRAVQEGDTYAAYRLGKEYLTDEHAPKSGEDVVRCFRSSVEQGNPSVQHILGKLYLDGEVLPHDQEQAVQWFQRSAAQGNRYAQLLLDRQNDFRPPGVMLSVTRLLHHLSRVFQENPMPTTSPGVLQIDRRRLLRLQEKRIALGRKADDHPEQGWGGMSMNGM